MSSHPYTLVEITPHAVAVMALEDCLRHLQRGHEQVEWITFAAKSAHLALQGALTAALAGSTSTGALDERLERAWIEALHGKRPVPASNRVMPFSDLLLKASTEPLPWSSEPLAVEDMEAKLLEQLNMVRSAVEHPKQGYHLIEANLVATPIIVAAKLTVAAAETVGHQFEDDQLEWLRKLEGDISAACSPWLKPSA